MEKEKKSIRKIKQGTPKRGNQKSGNPSGHTTIFDDVFRTMKEKMPFLLIPLVNEVFGTDYKAEDIVTHTADTHMTQLGKRITVASTNILYLLSDCRTTHCQTYGKSSYTSCFPFICSAMRSGCQRRAKMKMLKNVYFLTAERCMTDCTDSPQRE